MTRGEPWRRPLCEALVALSLSPDEQARANGPGCLTCDLLDDFELARRIAIESTSAPLSADQRQLLDRIDGIMTAMHEEDFACFDHEAVRRPVWQELRGLATETLRAFGWEGSTVEPFAEVEPGLWHRPPSSG